MKIHLNPPYSFHELGGRDNNEDCIFPKVNLATAKDTVFIVCDGVGGASKGEEASRLVCETLAACFDQSKGIAEEATLVQAVTQAEKALDAYLLDHPSARGMGTTMTFLQLHARGATIAHAGDSRVYQIRNGYLLFKTQDHSLMNDLIKNGTLSVAQARNHPQRNVITRAIQSTQRHIEPEVRLIEDVQAGDYFFMCTDGVLEQLSETMLCKTLAESNQTDAQKMATLKAICAGRTRDNFSAILVPIRTVEDPNPPAELDILEGDVQEMAVEMAKPAPIFLKPLIQDIPTSISRPVAVAKTPPVMPPPTVAKRRFFEEKGFKNGILTAIALGLVASLAFWFYDTPQKSSVEPRPKVSNEAKPPKQDAKKEVEKPPATSLGETTPPAKKPPATENTGELKPAAKDSTKKTPATGTTGELKPAAKDSATKTGTAPPAIGTTSSATGTTSELKPPAKPAKVTKDSVTKTGEPVKTNDVTKPGPGINQKN
jgi:protein phosphatase